MAKRKRTLVAILAELDACTPRPLGPYPAALKATLAGVPIRYTLHQICDGRVWSSPETFEAATMQHVTQAVLAGYLRGCARWAEDVDGLILVGMDASGNSTSATPISNLESVRDWHRRNAK